MNDAVRTVRTRGTPGAAATDAAPLGEPPLLLGGIVKSWTASGPPVLRGADLAVEGGTAVAISGANGAGKTTLLRIAAGLIAPEAGSVRVCGLDPERDRTAFHRRIGFLSAGNSGLYARLKAEEHLQLWARLALMPRRARGPAIERALDAFGLREICGRRVDRLSMGQRQRLRMALTFLHGPSVVLLDEPATSLDESGIALIGRALDDLRERGGAAVVCVPTGWGRMLPVDRDLVLADGLLGDA
ncbi:MAG TPA: ABC transporter ATP-binding protein [Thermoleophilaceae bacterium]|nr:ABC transporter ATP-binding protein [Thermoleophilaceae bacterium]